MDNKQGLVSKLADKFGVDPAKMLATLKATAFKVTTGEVSNEQMMSLLVVADQYGLNPFTREIFAFPDKKSGIVPVVGVDGWSRIINENPQFDGMEFNQSEKMVSLPGAKEAPEWMECVIHRKDRAHPIRVREYLDEVYRPPFKGKGKDGKPYETNGPWQSHTKRFLRHKVMIQASRLAFGYVGIYDQDEAERIIEGETVNEVVGKPVVTMPKAKSSKVIDAAPVESIPEPEMSADTAEFLKGYDNAVV
jgi:phage recombination protein Bet